jgi:hypothetical protein
MSTHYLPPCNPSFVRQPIHQTVSPPSLSVSQPVRTSVRLYNIPHFARSLARFILQPTFYLPPFLLPSAPSTSVGETSVRPPVRPSVRPSVRLSVRPSVPPAAYPFLPTSPPSSLRPSVGLSVCPSLPPLLPFPFSFRPPGPFIHLPRLCAFYLMGRPWSGLGCCTNDPLTVGCWGGSAARAGNRAFPSRTSWDTPRRRRSGRCSLSASRRWTRCWTRHHTAQPAVGNSSCQRAGGRSVAFRSPCPRNGVRLL